MVILLFFYYGAMLLHVEYQCAGRSSDNLRAVQCRAPMMACSTSRIEEQSVQCSMFLEPEIIRFRLSPAHEECQQLQKA
jgi:hypothetical protein